MKRTELCLDRETYLAWRNACPARLLSDLSHIGAWLVETSLPESIPPVETSLPESPASVARPASVAKGGTVKTTHEIALVVAENAALAALRKELKHEPTANQWLNYWKNGKDTEGTIKEVTRSEVVWTGKDNQIHRTALTTMNNRFSNAKKRNPFTPS